MIKTAYELQFFHGTSSKFLQRIMKEGLSSSPRERVFDEKYKREPGEIGLESYPGAYVSNNFMLAYTAAGVAQKKFGGNKLIVVGKVETRSPEARIDEDHIKEPGAGIAIQDRIVSDWYKHVNILEHYAFDADETAIRDASRAYVEKALEIKPTEEVMKRSIVALRSWLDMRIALALEREESGSYTWTGIIGKLKKRFNGSVPEKYMNVQKVTNEYRKAMDEFLAKAKELLANRKDGDDVLTNVRLTKPIAYKGANKIEAIIEIKQSDESPDEIIVHYAANRAAIGLMLVQYKQNIGADFEVK
jgi:hypothetical protein